MERLTQFKKRKLFGFKKQKIYDTYMRLANYDIIQNDENLLDGDFTFEQKNNFCA